MFQFSKRSAERMQGVNLQLSNIFFEAIKISPIDFGIPRDGGVRTVAEQNCLFLEDKSKCDGVINKSNHQSGDALDFYAYINGKASWDKVHLAMVASCILSTAEVMRKQGKISIELRWGGSFDSDDFNGWDFPHIEIIK